MLHVTPTVVKHCSDTTMHCKLARRTAMSAVALLHDSQPACRSGGVMGGYLAPAVLGIWEVE